MRSSRSIEGSKLLDFKTNKSLGELQQQSPLSRSVASTDESKRAKQRCSLIYYILINPDSKEQVENGENI